MGSMLSVDDSNTMREMISFTLRGANSDEAFRDGLAYRNMPPEIFQFHTIAANCQIFNFLIIGEPQLKRLGPSRRVSEAAAAWQEP